MTLPNKVAQFNADSDTVNAWLNGPASGPGSTLATAGGTLRTPNKLIADKDADINLAANGVLAQTVAVKQAADASALSASNSAGTSTTQAGIATTQAGLATTAKTAAELARDASLIQSGTYPDIAAGRSKGVKQLISLVAGSGGTNGTFALAFSGGGGSSAAGYFVVAGGIVIDQAITFTGYNYTSAPTVSFAASAGLTGASATAIIADVVADGQDYKVQGSGDVAAREYRRVNSTTSQPLAPYPSSNYVDRQARETQASRATTAVALFGDLGFEVAELTVDSVGRVMQGLGTDGAPLYSRKQRNVRREVSAVLLAGDVAAGVTKVAVYSDFREDQTQETLNKKVPLLSQRYLLPGDLEGAAVGMVGENARALPGSVETPSGLLNARRQVGPTGLAYLTGTTPNRAVMARLRDGREIKLSGSDDPSAFTQSGDTVTWLRTAGYPNEIADTLLAPEYFNATTTTIQGIIGHGQSNANGGNERGIVTPLPVRPEKAFMFIGGARLTQPTISTPITLPALAALDNLYERDGPTLNCGETPTSGVAYSLHASGGLASTVATINATFGVGEQSIGNIRKGTRPYDNLLRGVMRMKSIADVKNLPFTVPFIWWVQGESDVGTTANYKTALLQLQTDLDADIKAITGQSAVVLLAAAQTTSWSHPGAFTAAENPAVLAILELASEYPTRFMCTGPMYRFPYSTASTIHLSPAGMRLHGEMMGRAIRRRLVDGVTQTSLQAASASRSGAVITVTMTGAEGNLALDTSYVANTADGFFGITFKQDGATAPAISSVTVSGSTTVTITLEAVPTGTNMRVGFATTTALSVLPGPTTGPRCCLRDSATALFSDGSPMHKYANVQFISTL